MNENIEDDIEEFGTPISHEESLRRSKIISNIRKLMNIVGSLLCFFFAWLSIQNISFGPILNDYSASIILKATLLVYFSSWIAGISLDLSDEEHCLLVAPNKGNLTKMAIGIILGIGALFAILCMSKNFRLFSVCLFVFFLVDWLGNKYINYYAKTSIEKSKIKYVKNENYIGYMQMQSLQYYLFGRFNQLRYLIGFILILILIFFSFTNLPTLVAERFGLGSSQLILSLIFSVFVLIVETMMWYARLKRVFIFKTLQYIEQEYRVVKKK